MLVSRRVSFLPFSFDDSNAMNNTLFFSTRKPPIEEVSCNRGNPGLGGYTLDVL